MFIANGVMDGAEMIVKAPLELALHLKNSPVFAAFGCLWLPLAAFHPCPEGRLLSADVAISNTSNQKRPWRCGIPGSANDPTLRTINHRREERQGPIGNRSCMIRFLL